MALAGLGPSPLEGQQRSLRLESFQADIEVEADGGVVVTETLRPRFTGEWNGLLRDLSLRHRTAEGRQALLDVEILGVTDGEGRELEVDRERPSVEVRRLRIWLPDARDATRTVVVRYRVANAVRHFYDDTDAGPPRDELYWNVTGNDWQVPIQRASATVRLPGGATPLDVQPYTGFRGESRQDAEVLSEGGTVEVTVRETIRPGQGLTVSVSWPPGHVPRPGPAGRALQAVRTWWGAGMPLLTLLGMLGLWVRFGRDPTGRSVAVEYGPPEDLSPAEAGTLVDHEAEMHDLTSTVVDLAVRGFLRIEETEETRFLGLSTSTGYVFHLLQGPERWGELKPHERRFLRGLFKGKVAGLDPAVRPTEMLNRVAGFLDGVGRFLPESHRRALDGMEEEIRERVEAAEREAAAREATLPGPEESRDFDPATAEPLASVELEELKYAFSSAIAEVRERVYDRLEAEGYYDRRPDEVKQRWWGLGVLLIGVGAVAAAVSASLVVDLGHPLALLGGFGVSGLVMGLVGLAMPARTVKGARAREAALGFREFLQRVEEPRYRRMIRSPEDFERYLPFAMAFRVEDRWAKAFEDLVREPPDWYVGSHPGSSFRASRFSSDLRSMSSQASSTFTSTRSSSGGSSGFGGGGSSGGGSGGGGGGGF